jgi:3-methyladenine DNA glycosylase AlkD
MLKAKSSKAVVVSMSKFGIDAKDAIGVTVPEIRKIAKTVGKNHKIALELWDSKIHDARVLASMVDDPKLVTEAQMESWVKEISSWDVCDSCCGNLFDKTKFAYTKATEWSKRKEEYVKRAGFALMAYIAVHDKAASNNELAKFLPIIERESVDDRNFVKKAVNWALRQIGKRNKELNRQAISMAERIILKDSKSARWIATDALRELKSDAVQGRLNGKD